MFAYCENNPVLYSDYNGKGPLIPQEVLDAVKEVVDTILGFLFYVKGRANAKGQYYEYWLDKENNLKWIRHNSDHGNPSKHENPHDHPVIKDDDNNDTLGPGQPPNPGFQAPPTSQNNNGNNSNSNFTRAAETTGIVVIGSIAIYEIGKWGLAAFLVPWSGGGSLAVAAAIP